MNSALPELPVRSFLVICLLSPIGVALLVRAWLSIWRTIRPQPASRTIALHRYRDLDSDPKREKAMLTPCTSANMGCVPGVATSMLLTDEVE